MDVTGYTAARMKSIEDNSVVDGTVNGSGHLILTKRNNATIDAGNVVGPQGVKGDTGGIADAPNDGGSYVRKGALWVPMSDDFPALLGSYINKYQAVVTGGPVGGTGVTLATITVPAVSVNSVIECSAFWTAYNTEADNTFRMEIIVNGSLVARIKNRHESAVNERRPYSIPTSLLTTISAGNGATVLVNCVREASGVNVGVLTQDASGYATATVTPV